MLNTTEKEAPKTKWELPRALFLKEEIIKKRPQLDIRQILIDAQSYVHDGKFEPSEDRLKPYQNSQEKR